jgi:hypothetical protein
MSVLPFPQDDHDLLDQEIHDRDVQADRAAALDEMAAGVIAALDDERLKARWKARAHVQQDERAGAWAAWKAQQSQ